jgi:hypothetical protein
MPTIAFSLATTVRRLRLGRRGRSSLLIPLVATLAMAARCTGCEANRADVSVPDPPPLEAPAR